MLLLLLSCFVDIGRQGKIFCYDPTDSTHDSDITKNTSVFLQGEKEDDLAGNFIAVGDVDGDDGDDILIGAPGNDLAGVDAGKAYLMLARTLPPGGIGQHIISLGNADYVFLGEREGDRAGFAGASGDIDGDGKADILIGAPGNDDGGEDAGKLYLFLGSGLQGGQTFSLVDADYVFLGENEGDNIGESISLGDVDGDGKADILIGAKQHNSAAGKTYLILGSSIADSQTINLADADYMFIGEASNDQSGSSVANTGDVDGDGKDDILIGAPGNVAQGADTGKTYLILSSSLDGESEHSLSSVDKTLTGDNTYKDIGSMVSFIDDIDGDAKAEIVVRGSDFNETESTLHLFLSASSTSASIPASGSILFSGEFLSLLYNNLYVFNENDGVKIYLLNTDLSQIEWEWEDSSLSHVDSIGVKAIEGAKLQTESVETLLIADPIAIEFTGEGYYIDDKLGAVYMIYPCQSPFPSSTED